MMSMAQVLQIPIARPIFEREVGNRMYSPTAYYLSHVAACLCIFFIYPCFTSMISYWYFGMKVTDWAGLFDWMFCLALPALAGALWGFSFGTFFHNELNALQGNLVFILMFNLGAGHTTNLGKSANLFAKFISTVSPVRYATEMLMYRILSGSAAEKVILLNLGYTTGNSNCMAAFAIITVILFSIGWINLVHKNRLNY